MPRPTTIALIADTHLRPEHGDRQRAYPSDAEHNDRVRAAVARLAHLAPERVVHLGDVVHPIPALPTHQPTVEAARELFQTIGCPVEVVPGNHDVGDKPSPVDHAPRADARGLAVFERAWGPGFRSFDQAGCHFVVVDTTVMNTGTTREVEQRRFLEADLAAGHPRVFLLTHYPPFLHHPDEPEHYDNIGQPARGWLLDLVCRSKVEAVLSGHVHGFYYNRLGPTDLYVLPSVAFARPGYAERFGATPEPGTEHGRNDRGRLGFGVLEILPDGHRLQIHSTSEDIEPTRALPLGLWLRHALAPTAELPCGDLDPLTRKVVRNDEPMRRLVELRAARIRIPASDLADAALVDRVRWLRRHGVSTAAYTVGVPTAEVVEQMRAAADELCGWEVVCPAHLLTEATRSLPADLPLRPTWSALVTGGVDPEGYFSHFPHLGLDPDGPLPDLDPSRWAGLALRARAEVWAKAATAVQVAEERGLRAVIHVELPVAGEAAMQSDDHAVTRVAVEAALAAAAHPEHAVYLDGLVDKDRGYYPHRALLDRWCNPRPAFRALRRLARHLAPGSPPEQVAAGFDVGDALVVLEPRASSASGPWVDLEAGRRCVEAPAGPALRGRSRP